MDCREFKKILEDGREPGEEAEAHLAACSGCRELRTGEARLTALLRGLPRAQAPADFELGFRTKLARTKELKRPLPPVWNALRYGLPAAAAALILGFVIFNSNLFRPAAGPDPVAEVQETPAATSGGTDAAPSSAGPEEELTADAGEEPGPAAGIDRSSSNTERRSDAGGADVGNKSAPEGAVERDDIEVRDTRPEEDRTKTLALTENKPINPPGIEPDKKIDTPPVQPSPAEFTAREVLSQLGIEASFADGGWKVAAVRKNSAAETSGVRTGDVVLAIDGQRLTAGPLEKGSFQGRTLTVRRGASELGIDIRN